MDDTQARETLDDLAELFLTGISPGAGSGVESSAAPPPRKAPPARATTTLRHRVGGDDPLDGPLPIRLEPKVSAAPRPVMHDAQAHLFEQHDPSPSRDAASPNIAETRPRLRLHRGDGRAPQVIYGPGDDPSADSVAVHDPPPPPEAAQQPDETYEDEVVDTADDSPPLHAFVEAVFLGNLPGLSGPWLTQYAQFLAQQDGPAAVLHVDEPGQLSIELVEPADATFSPRRVPPSRERGRDALSVVRGLFRGNSPVRTLLLHFAPESDRGALRRPMMFAEWTLLCGADDAAVVGGYRLLKQMVDAEPGVSRQHVGLMVMGSDESPSRDAAHRIAAAARSHLHTPVLMIGSQKQMTPVNLRQVGTFDLTDADWHRLAGFLRELRTPEDDARPVRPQPIAATAEPEPEPEHEPEPETVASPGLDLTPNGPAVLVKEPKVRPRKVHTITPTSQTRRTAAPRAVEPCDGPSDPPDLIELLTTASRDVSGGVSLEARCPDHPQTQLMLDQSGGLHLLRRHVSRGDEQRVVGDLRTAILDLVEARRWVSEHIELIKLTQRQCRFDNEAQPMVHLFTDRADLATGLVARLRGMLKLHLLQRIELGGESAWYCTPLN